MNYQEALDWLYSTQTFGIKLGLEAPKKLLREFLAFPAHTTKVIHVAGTNGKGSTCAIIDSLGRSLGIRTGLFTSPHLIDFRERVQIMGVPIAKDKTAALLTELRDLVSDWEHHPTFFELTLALGMRHFRDSGCSLIALETGMGGRLDATTAVPADVCVLTPIAMDHSKWLGETLSEIAFEKASIALRGIPLISSKQDPEARTEIAKTANQLQAPLTFVERPLEGYSISLEGQHQRHNAALACEAMIAAGYQLTSDVVQYAMARIDWPGRFEAVSKTLTLDAAHNPQAAQTLVATFLAHHPQEKAHIIFGSVEDKDSRHIIHILEPITDTFHFVPVNSPRGIDPKEHHTTLPSQIHQSLPQALEATKGKRTLVTGSLFLIGEVKAHLQETNTRLSSQ